MKLSTKNWYSTANIVVLMFCLLLTYQNTGPPSTTIHISYTSQYVTDRCNSQLLSRHQSIDRRQKYEFGTTRCMRHKSRWSTSSLKETRIRQQRWRTGEREAGERRRDEESTPMVCPSNTHTYTHARRRRCNSDNIDDASIRGRALATGSSPSPSPSLSRDFRWICISARVRIVWSRNGLSDREAVPVSGAAERSRRAYRSLADGRPCRSANRRLRDVGGLAWAIIRGHYVERESHSFDDRRAMATWMVGHSVGQYTTVSLVSLVSSSSRRTTLASERANARAAMARQPVRPSVRRPLYRTVVEGGHRWRWRRTEDRGRRRSSRPARTPRRIDTGANWRPLISNRRHSLWTVDRRRNARSGFRHGKRLGVAAAWWKRELHCTARDNGTALHYTSFRAIRLLQQRQQLIVLKLLSANLEDIRYIRFQFVEVICTYYRLVDYRYRRTGLLRIDVLYKILEVRDKSVSSIRTFKSWHRLLFTTLEIQDKIPPFKFKQIDE